MLRVLDHRIVPLAIDDTGERLFERNSRVHLRIEAPLYWWLDSATYYTHSPMEFPKSYVSQCLDEWTESTPYIQMMQMALNKRMPDRKKLQILPLSTLVTANMELGYKDVLEICENYECGEYAEDGNLFQWPLLQEWEDLYNELIKLRGVIELLKGE